MENPPQQLIVYSTFVNINKILIVFRNTKIIRTVDILSSFCHLVPDIILKSLNFWPIQKSAQFAVGAEVSPHSQ
jgi:hypothetical protein